MVLAPITASKLRQELTRAAPSAAAWDQWEHEEWAALPMLAVERLAKLLVCIEFGACWPQQTRWGKAFFLSKVQGVTTDPMDFRVLFTSATALPSLGRHEV